MDGKVQLMVIFSLNTLAKGNRLETMDDTGAIGESESRG